MEDQRETFFLAFGRWIARCMAAARFRTSRAVAHDLDGGANGEGRPELTLERAVFLAGDVADCWPVAELLPMLQTVAS